jgi:thiamine pyrophosphate-dependent acetolactate synthase large subunit-like protein
VIETAEMLRLFARYRGEAIVIPGRGGRHWVEISTCPERDLALGDPAMGGHASFALGLALARPNDRVVVFDSEGDLLMGLGALATIAEQRPPNLYHFLLDNECYATTGGQPVPNARGIAYDALARAAGYPRAYAFDNLEGLARALERILREPGPVLVAMKVVPEIENRPIRERPRWQRRPREQRILEFRRALALR